MIRPPRGRSPSQLSGSSVTRWPRFSLLANLALGASSLVLFLGGAEGVSRLVEAAKPERPRAPYITDWAAWDGDFYTVKSTAVGWPPWEDYNRDGLRDREHALAKPKGVRRVISLGDSTTLGWRLRPEEAYPQVLQDRASALGQNLEVFNVALGGWSTRQELIAYRRIARAYHPDIVLLGICLNDFAEMQNNLARPPAWLAALHLRSALVRRIVRAEDREIGSIEELFAEPPSRPGRGRVPPGVRRRAGRARRSQGRWRRPRRSRAAVPATGRAGRAARRSPEAGGRVLRPREDPASRPPPGPPRDGGHGLHRPGASERPWRAAGRRGGSRVGGVGRRRGRRRGGRLSAQRRGDGAGKGPRERHGRAAHSEPRQHAFRGSRRGGPSPRHRGVRCGIGHGTADRGASRIRWPTCVRRRPGPSVESARLPPGPSRLSTRARATRAPRRARGRPGRWAASARARSPPPSRSSNGSGTRTKR